MIDEHGTTWNLEQSQVESPQDWANLIGDIYAPISVQDAPETFSGQIRNTGTDGVQISRLTVGKHVSQRLARDIRQSESPKLVVCLQISGTGTVRQDEREVVLHPGDMTVYSTTIPYELDFREEAEVIGVVVPWGSLAQAPLAAHHLSAELIAGDDPVTRAVFNSVVNIEPELLDMPIASRRRLVRNVVDLMSTLCLANIEQRMAARAPLGKSDRLSQALSFIEDNLADPELSLDMVAARNFVSVRTLQQRASETGCGIPEWIRERRLEKCKTDLVEYPDRSVASIAASWGMTNAAYFSQVFKQQFGVGPREYRARSLSLLLE